MELLRKIERGIVVVLVALMVIVVVLATVDLVWNIARDIITPPVVLLDVEELLDVFGLFLLVLIGVELLSTLSSYLRNHTIHAEVVVEVAMIAIARKVIILDLKEYTALTMVGIGAIIVALTAAFFVLRRWRRQENEGDGQPRTPKEESRTPGA